MTTVVREYSPAIDGTCPRIYGVCTCLWRLYSNHQRCTRHRLCLFINLVNKIHHSRTFWTSGAAKCTEQKEDHITPMNQEEISGRGDKGYSNSRMTGSGSAPCSNIRNFPFQTRCEVSDLQRGGKINSRSPLGPRIHPSSRTW